MRFPLIVKQGTILLKMCEIISETAVFNPDHDQNVFRKLHTY